MDTSRDFAAYRLVGITKGESECEHCGRALGRLFRLVGPEGDEMVVGRVCSAKLTGYNWSVKDAERAQRIADAEAKAAADYGQLWTEIVAQSRYEGQRFGYGGAATEGMIVLRDRRWMTDDEARAFAEKALADSVAFAGAA